ncbi:hypothetical protein DACRYDRAFT_104644 [Dacryopinax primogenitus]|uniref:Uncharacterized protein n=1 Tax=Dacryopinax primogenitus (strain DJM 731) TaxID=1858805 RepID=M5G993_DACPD|nr:uncharacterized protein DACRYDRAFT_104644 [Dacryopinax primogenitus]EJU04770.1 hypothetical protein DACRYDRAFT_104644 [Dacryopinax primogenitus]
MSTPVPVNQQPLRLHIPATMLTTLTQCQGSNCDQLLLVGNVGDAYIVPGAGGKVIARRLRKVLMLANGEGPRCDGAIVD